MPEPNNYGTLESVSVPAKGFIFTPTDATNIIDPNTSREVLVRVVTTTVDGVIKVTYAFGGTAVIVPMIAGVPRSMVVKKIFSTDTTAGITSAGVICEM